MRIIRGRDYYDGAGLGIDPGIVFVRTEEAVEAPVLGDLPRTIEINGADSNHLYFSFHAVLVAGKAYPFVKVFHRWQEGPGEFVYDLARALTLYNDAMDAIRSSGARNFWGAMEGPKRLEEHFHAYEPGRRAEMVMDWAIRSHVTTGIGSIEHHFDKNRRRIVGRPEVIANTATLKDVEFYRVMDPTSIHMAISSFIGGVLSSNPDIIEISDSTRIRKAGFDLKTSFRKPKAIF